MAWNYAYARWSQYGYWSDYYWNSDGSSSQGSNGPPEEMDYVYLDGYTPEGYGDSYMPSSGEFYSFDGTGLGNAFYMSSGALYTQYYYPGGYEDGGYVYCSYSADGSSSYQDQLSQYLYMVYNSESSQGISGGSYSLGYLTIDNSGVSECYAYSDFICEGLDVNSGELDLNYYTPQVRGSFYLGGGTIYGGGGLLEVDGNVTYSSGDSVDLDVRMIGAGASLDWYEYSDDGRLQSLTVAGGADATLSNHLYTEGLHIENGGALYDGGTSRRVLLYWPSDEHFVSCDGTCNASVDVTIFNDRWNSLDVTGLAYNFKLYTTSGNIKTLVQSGDIQAGSDIEVSNLQNDGGYATLELTGGITCDTLRLGAPSAVNGSGRIRMGDRVHTVNYVTKGNAANTNNAMDLQGCTLHCTQIFDGEYITATSAGANLHGGEVRSLNATGVVHCWGMDSIASHSNSVDVVHEGSNASPNGAHMGMGCAA